MTAARVRGGAASVAPIQTHFRPDTDPADRAGTPTLVQFPVAGGGSQGAATGLVKILHSRIWDPNYFRTFGSPLAG